MADRASSISRRRVLGAAAALPVATLLSPSALADPGPQRLWDRRLARYRRCAAAAREAAEKGWFFAANRRFEREKAAARRDDAARAAAWARLDAAEDAYWRRCTEPMQKAAVALALTPAPDLAALGEKIAVMRAEQLHELERMERGCFDVLAADVRRLAGKRTPSPRA